VQRSSDLLHFYSLLAHGLSTSSTADVVPPGEAYGAQHTQAGRAATSQHAEQGAMPSVRSAAESTITAMVQRRWTLTELDSLPFGTALPLRAALLFCRAQPPEGGLCHTDYSHCKTSDLVSSLLIIGTWLRCLQASA
jgi:hypothetical protein